MALNSIEEHEHALFLLYRSIIAALTQTFVYGIYAVLVPVSTYIMLRRGLATRARKVLYGMIIFMFIQSTASWIASISALIQLIQVWFLAADPDVGTEPHYTVLFSALMSINYILTDGVVVWRAWVLCSADGTKALTVCLLILCLGIVSVITTVAIRIALVVINTQTGILFDRLNHGINATQVATLVFSILTNSIATSLISIKAWRCRDEIQENMDAATGTNARIGKTFALLIETGVLYTLSCIMVLIFTVIPLKEGTLGDVYTPVNTQLAGIYPVAVLLLVTHNQSLNRTVRAFASGVEQTGIHVTTKQLASTIQFERRSVILISVGSAMSGGSNHLDGNTHHFNKPYMSLPSIPSSKITWGEFRESV
ncbi:hypothetical protein GYMLUDRAFT_615342 [Collybiopsis luxurians FD-317 M1]|uniref:Uncharacterized protein n=1 Tax=Collybiopsis luxurians FD-317 M1 TaxID=944289 RepID=A0A0D0CVZ3_9AGAR|nr:hypothetical protein GYMLUDRAFT_615342 [Collybiopsis luxurians FD-317 M1]